MNVSTQVFRGMAVAAIFILLFSAPVSASTKVPAQDMLESARNGVAETDPDAWMVKVKFSKGDEKCRFEKGRFTFASPRLKAEGERKDCLRVYVKGDKVEKIQQRSDYRDKDMPDPHPKKAFEAAMESGFKKWWEKQEQVWLYMELWPESGKYGHRCPGNTRYVWKIMGSGPGADEDYRVYVDPTTMKVCEEEIKHHGGETEKIKKSLEDVKKILKK